ncbi:right-handed parallel beta-helix repeat-containing protein [Spirosoma rigui]|uniref:right-handed parallel beta-helix repeat-containing protein n=1 Tax=Spirosoma rigui TaxID=564064 RepID=UPI0009B16332|nr:right-handed parallel beta-helix repeat-containing protein [Spirosoma rigui]
MLIASSLLLILSTISSLFVDQTQIIQQLINRNAGKTVTIPPGTYIVRTIDVPKQTQLIIGSKTILKGAPGSQSLPILNLATGVQIRGTGLIDGNRSVRRKGMGIRIFDAQGIKITGIRIRNVAEQGIQIAGCTNVTLTNVQVNGCGAKGNDQFQGINFVTSKNVRVTGCRIANAQHGIQWWGDDTNGWCEDFRITGNQIQNVDGGGIWGNKGRRITVATNTVKTCGDVGVDFEHSVDCSATNNIVSDCKNYGLATFHSSERITFTNNKVYQGVKYGHGIGLIGDGTSKNISFTGGIITTKGATACGLLTVGTNVASIITVKGIRITTEGKSGIPIRIIDNNQFRLTNNLITSIIGSTGISLEGSSNSLVEGNTIVHRGTDTSKKGDRGGIFVYFRSPEYPAQGNKIMRNTIQGFTTGINDECWGNVNSNNVFEQNTTPNIVHRASNGTWGGKVIQNQTRARVMAPVEIKQ